MIHILNGDATARVFEHSGLGGDVFVWQDILVEGPPAPGPGRAAHLAARFGIEAEAYLRERRQEAARLEALDRDDEIVLWFEQDLFCAVNLWFLLHWFAGRSASRLSLIFPAQPPGVDAVRGLGGLASARLAALFAERVPVSAAMLSLGREAWRAYAGSSPRALEAMLGPGPSALPFLAAALRCHLGRFPSVASGVGEVEEAILETLAVGPLGLSRLFTIAGHRLRAHGMGDVQFAAHVRELAEGPEALVEGFERSTTSESMLSLTALGRDVLEGRADWLAHHRLDRWLGGVHLHPGAPLWRCDRGRERLREG